jgi:hypothetical protein
MLPSLSPRLAPLPMPPGRFPLAGAGALGIAAALLVLSPTPGRSEELYRLNTTCALRGAAPVDCVVVATDEGPYTLYRHQIGKVMETVRITDDPVRMTIWRNDAKTWEPIRNATARFSTNTVCFNGRELCVVNPNYLNSVREDRANNARLAGRDLVMVHFGKDGRVDASCYDDACALVKK